MTERGGRRQHTWSAPLSWRELRVVDLAPSLAAIGQVPIGRADWLLAVAEPVLRAAATDPDLPTALRQNAQHALDGLQEECAKIAARPPLRGRPPVRRPTAGSLRRAVRKMLRPPRPHLRNTCYAEYG